MGQFKTKQSDALETIDAILDLLLGSDRSCVFSYSRVHLCYADDGVNEIRQKVDLAVQVISLLCGVTYKATRFVEEKSA